MFGGGTLSSLGHVPLVGCSPLKMRFNLNPCVGFGGINMQGLEKFNNLFVE